MATATQLMPSPTAGHLKSAFSPYTDSPSSPAPFSQVFQSNRCDRPVLRVSWPRVLVLMSSSRSSNTSDHLVPPPSPYPATVDPSPVDSNGTNHTDHTEVGSVASRRVESLQMFGGANPTTDRRRCAGEPGRRGRHERHQVAGHRRRSQPGEPGKSRNGMPQQHQSFSCTQLTSRSRTDSTRQSPCEHAQIQTMRRHQLYMHLHTSNNLYVLRPTWLHYIAADADTRTGRVPPARLRMHTRPRARPWCRHQHQRPT